MNRTSKTALTVIEGGRGDIERRLVETFFTPYLPDNTLVSEQLAVQLKPRINPASLALFSQEPPRR